jgi:hypothetical protein
MNEEGEVYAKLSPYSRIVLAGLLAATDYRNALTNAIVADKRYAKSTLQSYKYYSPFVNKSLEELSEERLIDEKGEPTALAWRVIPRDQTAGLANKLRVAKKELARELEEERKRCFGIQQEKYALEGQLRNANRAVERYQALQELEDHDLGRLGLDADWVVAVAALNAQEVAVAKRLKQLNRFDPWKLRQGRHGPIRERKNFHDLVSDLEKVLGETSPEILLATAEAYRRARGVLCHEGKPLDTNTQRHVLSTTENLINALGY